MSEDTRELPTDSAQDPLVGKLLGGKYQLRELIARGGMGRIFRAEQRPLGREVAVKVLAIDTDRAVDPHFEQRFFLEAATLGRLKHPNTVTVFDYGFVAEESVYFMAMELVEGENLARLVKQQGRLPPGRAVRIVYEVVRSLVEAHELGIVHRDLKPANIMIASNEEGDRIKVLDFGIAKVLVGGDEDITKAEMLVGSPKFMSPEQIRHQPIDQRSDIYSLGIVLFYLITGAEPFRGNSAMDTLIAHLHQPIPALKDAGITVPPAVQTVIRKCLEKNPADRYQTSVELKIALKQAMISLDPTVTGPTPTLSRSDLSLDATAVMGPTSTRGTRILGVVGLLAVGFAVALTAVAWWLWPRSAPEPSLPVPVAAAPPPQVPAPAEIRILLTSEPSGAEVREGGEILGTTPMSLGWAATESDPPREFELRLAGYETAIVSQPPAATDQAQNVVLRPAPVAGPRPQPVKKPPKTDIMLER